ncbi:hypothetical protein EP47_01270 [Legionella norrlandica]|uniref:Uncharacterized protein n=1 Tax=Legionella norrlandica TaxID=1498499 RepID=A0A0A2T595_9GAMM|nr:hypothetical protein [Legionella norrlandica]KGP62608.1 hypothetical protein EP47_01270 [Legionella norrlandica]
MELVNTTIANLLKEADNLLSLQLQNLILNPGFVLQGVKARYDLLGVEEVNQNTLDDFLENYFDNQGNLKSNLESTNKIFQAMITKDKDLRFRNFEIEKESLSDKQKFILDSISFQLCANVLDEVDKMTNKVVESHNFFPVETIGFITQMVNKYSEKQLEFYHIINSLDEEQQKKFKALGVEQQRIIKTTIENVHAKTKSFQENITADWKDSAKTAEIEQPIQQYKTAVVKESIRVLLDAAEGKDASFNMKNIEREEQAVSHVLKKRRNPVGDAILFALTNTILAIVTLGIFNISHAVVHRDRHPSAGNLAERIGQSVLDGNLLFYGKTDSSREFTYHNRDLQAGIETVKEQLVNIKKEEPAKQQSEEQPKPDESDEEQIKPGNS